MLEDYTTMEKKTNGRSLQPPPKGGATESKKCTETGASKPFDKYSRRREPATFSNTTKNETTRKQSSNKNAKYFDKRPRNRGQYLGCGRTETKVADNEDPEYGSLYVPGTKKQNLNHLLNFHYTPRNMGLREGNNWTSTGSAKYFATHKHKYNKEHFLQANCQFIVKAGEDYSQHLINPDLLVNWESVEQICLQSVAFVSCPICLDTPNAAKMTRCGHVYCWPCILHYLALSDKSWRKCPICYEAVHRKDLKSVTISTHTQYSVGEELMLKLMRRERGSLLPVPVEQQQTHNTNMLLSVSEKNMQTIYSKLLLARPDEVSNILDREREELKRQLIENEGCPELCFIEEAMQLLSEREQELNKRLLPSVDELCTGVKSHLRVSESSEDSVVVPVEEHDSHSDDDSLRVTADDLDISHVQSSSDAPKPYYFYQAGDGQHIYLHALNVKMLELEYGSLEQCPAVIKGKILEKEAGSMTEELRKRLRYLKHLPLTCQFEVAEIDLSHCVSEDVFVAFREQIEGKARRRVKRAREERRREKTITNEEKMKWGLHPTPRLRIESHVQFPTCGTEVDELGNIQPPSPAGSSTVSRSQSLSSICSLTTGPELKSSSELSISQSLDYTGPSFAQMLREGKTMPRARVHNKSTSVTDVPTTTASPSSGDPDVDFYVNAPQFKQSFSDAIAAALEKAESGEGEHVPLNKKRKKKQKILFVTGMACSGK